MDSKVIVCPICHEPTMASQCAPGVKTMVVLGSGTNSVAADLTLEMVTPKGPVCRRCLGGLLSSVAPDLIGSLIGEKDIDRIQFRVHPIDGDEEEGGHA